MKDLYITQSGTIERHENSIRFANESTTKLIPINDINSIYALGEVSLNSKLLTYLSKFQIPIYFFNYYGFYTGIFAPKQQAVSGKLLIKQVEFYQDKAKRIEIAKEFLYGALHNMRKTLMQYHLEDSVEKINTFEKKINDNNNIKFLLLVEAEFRHFYFKQFNKIISNKEFEFIKRTRQPPDNFINALISFGNSLLYTTTLSEIFKTQLNPTIAYLHEPFERRYSLNLDIAEIFKPLIVDRVIFTLINKNIIKPEHFDKDLNFCYLSDEGRKLFLREYDAKLNTTIKYPALNRIVSYRYMLRLECYKLIKCFLEGKPYKSFKIYW